MVERERETLQRAYLSSIRALLTALEARDEYTRGHSEQVRSWAIRIAQRLGLPLSQVDVIGQAARLHDIGKVGIRGAILFKPSPLTAKEWQAMRGHPELGVSILTPIRLLQATLPIIRGHHERWDGKGYPDGLRGEDIPLGARIVAVADAYDALKSNRPYRRGFLSEEARHILSEGAGTQWDEQIVTALLDLRAGLRVVHLNAVEQIRRVTDPVCGMGIYPDHAQARAQYRGSMVYFCSPDCREVFDQSPENYV
jgi:HD-GYP domain-containing protein (c-di-GMP phosphodiesterase class II)